MARPTIAVVNQDTTFLDLMDELLAEEGYKTMILKEGSTAYQQIKKHKPDLVILDIRLNDPEAGFMVIELMRIDPETAALPIIICTTSTQLIRDNEELLRAKNCDFLMKPFHIDELLLKVAAAVGQPT